MAPDPAGKSERSGAKAEPVRRHFGVGETARLTGISRITLHLWDRSGFLCPSVHPGGRGTGNRRKYSFADLVALRVVRRLRSEGVSLLALRKAAKYLRAKEGTENPFAERYLAVCGKDILMVRGEEAVSLLGKPGQYTFLLKLDLSREAELLTRELTGRAA